MPRRIRETQLSLLTEVRSGTRARRRRQSRGNGSFYRRDRVWWIKYKHRGGVRRESSGSSDKRTAERLLARRLDEIGADRLGLRPFIGPVEDRLTVDDLLDAALDAYCIARNIDRIEIPPSMLSHTKPIREAFGGWKAANLREEDLDRYIVARRREGRAPATINRELETLRRALHLAVSRKRLASMPQVPRLREQNVRRGFFSHRAFESLVANLPDYLQDFARFAYHSGWRKGEITSLTWADVDREGGTIHLRPEASKNGRGRMLPIEDEIARIVARRRLAHRLVTQEGARLVPFVFHRAGRPIGDIRKAWRTAAEAAGLPGRIFHDLRRTAVRNMVRAGVREGVAMEISGHRTRSVFDRYNITSEADLRDAIRRTVRHVRRADEADATASVIGCGNRGRPAAVPRFHDHDDDGI